MLENSTFNDEWNNLQKSFWEKVDSKFNENKNSQENLKHILPLELPLLFEQWFMDVDKCWQDHAQDTSSDINSLYKKLSSTNRYFFNSSGLIVTPKKYDVIDAVVSEYLENMSKMFEEITDDISKENATDSDDIKSHKINIDSILKLPLENYQRHVTLFASQFTNQKQSINAVSENIAFDSNNSELSAALEAYLLAMQEYQRLFFNLFTMTAKDLLEVLRSNNDKGSPTTRTMTIWLEMLDGNYKALISGNEYSKIYANVINSWMLVFNKSNQSFSEFMQSASTTSSDQSKS